MSTAALALWLYLAWFLLAFVVRGAIQWRRTGDHGFRLGTERRWSGAWWARLGFVVALVVGAAAPACAALDLVGPIDALDSAVGHRLGVGLVVAGVLATFVAQVAMGRAWRVGVDPTERTELVVRWPFTLVRNPIFSTMAVTAVGFALLVPSVLALAGLALLAWALEHQVRRVEEPYLRALHGERYATYEAAVGRFVPGVGRG